MLAGHSGYARAMPKRKDPPPGVASIDGPSRPQEAAGGSGRAAAAGDAGPSSNPLAPTAPNAFERANSSIEALRMRALAGAARRDPIEQPPLVSACCSWMPFRLIADQALAQSNAWSFVWTDEAMKSWAASFSAERALLISTATTSTFSLPPHLMQPGVDGNSHRTECSWHWISRMEKARTELFQVKEGKKFPRHRKEGLSRGRRSSCWRAAPYMHATIYMTRGTTASELLS